MIQFIIEQFAPVKSIAQKYFKRLVNFDVVPAVIGSDFDMLPLDIVTHLADNAEFDFAEKRNARSDDQRTIKTNLARQFCFGYIALLTVAVAITVPNRDITADVVASFELLGCLFHKK